MTIAVRTRALRTAQCVFAAAGLAALGYCVAVYAGAEHFQAKETAAFQRTAHAGEMGARSSPSSRAAPAIPAKGSVVGRLEIPRVGVAVMVVEGVDDAELRRAAGHIPGTALPGESGNVGIAGHRDTFFRPLRDVHRDDAITLETRHGADHYRVVSTQIVGPEDIKVLHATGQDCLTLVTCFPFHFVGRAPKRFVVRAVRSSGSYSP